jgi:phenylacetate-CoA ligase
LSMYAKLNRGLYFLAQAYRQEPVLHALSDLRKTFYWDAEKLRQLQHERLMKLVKHAYKTVPFYSQYYQTWSNEIEHATVESIGELIKKLPSVQKRDVIANRSKFYSRRNSKCYTNISSGTTGEPFAYPCDQLSWAYRHASLIRLLEYYGVALGSSYGYFFGQHWKNELRFKTAVKDWFFNRIRFSAFSIDNAQVKKSYTYFLRKKIHYFLGYPSVIVAFCKIAKEELQLDLTKLNLRLIVTTGETLENYQKNYLASIFSIPIVNYYGSAEGGFAAFAGKEGRMHVNMETCYLEQNADHKLSKTDLFLRQFPLIKIQTDDISTPIKISSETELNRPYIDQIHGRTGEEIILPNKQKVHAVILDYFFDLFINDPNILKFRFEFTAKNVVLLIKSNKPKLENSFVVKIKKEFNDLFNDVELHVKQVGEIGELANGKNRPWIQRKDA